MERFIAGNGTILNFQTAKRLLVEEGGKWHELQITVTQPNQKFLSSIYQDQAKRSGEAQDHEMFKFVASSTTPFHHGRVTPAEELSLEKKRELAQYWTREVEKHEKQHTPKVLKSNEIVALKTLLNKEPTSDNRVFYLEYFRRLAPKYPLSDVELDIKKKLLDALDATSCKVLHLSKVISRKEYDAWAYRYQGVKSLLEDEVKVKLDTEIITPIGYIKELQAIERRLNREIPCPGIFGTAIDPSQRGGGIVIGDSDELNRALALGSIYFGNRFKTKADIREVLQQDKGLSPKRDIPYLLEIYRRLEEKFSELTTLEYSLWGFCAYHAELQN